MSEITLSRTKVIVPLLRPEILHRPRLLALFDNVLDRKLVLITAPAGYGKTTLLVDFARISEMPVCWLSLDALDNDPQRFSSYLIAAIEQRFPRFGKQAYSTLRNLTSFEQEAERFLAALTNEIYEQIDEHFVLVLDDYHFVDSVPAIRDFLSRFIYLAGENCHIILSSRRLPALPDITLMVARQQVSGFDLEALSFRPDETRILFEKNYGAVLEQNIVEVIMHQTEGWITGLLLSAAGAVRGTPDPSGGSLRASLGLAARSAGVDLAVYFDQQVLALQPPALRDFLLQTSLLEEFDADLCDAVLGVGDWKKQIGIVRKNNLFIQEVGEEGKWLRYHHLFQEFLQERMQEEEPEAAQAISARLAGVCEERGEWERAYAIYQQNGNRDALADLVERAGISLIQNDKFITLGNWLDSLPDAVIRQRPGLLSLRGVILLVRGKARDGLPLLTQAVSAFRLRDHTSGLALALVRRAAVLRALGDYSDSLVDADEVLDFPAVTDDMLGNHAEACRLKSWNLLRLGQPLQALEWAERSLALYYRLNAASSIPMALSNLGMIRRAIGETDAACEAYEKAYALGNEQGNLTNQAGVGNSLGVLYHSRGEYETAAHYFEEGMKSAHRSGYSRHEVLILASMGDLYSEVGDIELAAQAFEKVELFARQSNDHFLLFYALVARAGLARISRTFDRAQIFLNEARAESGFPESHYEQGLYELECGRLELVAGHPAEAVKHIHAAQAHFETGSLVLETGWARLWLAAACSASGEGEASRASLEAVGELLTRGASVHSLGMEACLVREWLEPSIRETNSGSVLKRLLDAAAPTQSRLPAIRKRLRRLTSTVSQPVPRLVIRAFGKGQVWLNGRLVTNNQWKAQAVRELFFYFLNKSDSVTKEQVGMEFWPDASQAQLKLRFKNNLYRLRNALGPEVILFDKDRYRFNFEMDYDYDVENFTEILRRASHTTEETERIRIYEELVVSVRGPFLEDIHSEWIEPEREHLKQALLSALLSLSELHLQRGSKDSALKACQRALAIDPYFEEAHRLKMRIHARQGDRAAISRQYEACRRIFETDLGVSISPETNALYRELTS